MAFERLVDLIAAEPRFWEAHLPHLLRNQRLVEYRGRDGFISSLKLLDAVYTKVEKHRELAGKQFQGLFANHSAYHQVISPGAAANCLRRLAWQIDGPIWSALSPSAAAALVASDDPEERSDWIWLMAHVGAWPEVEELLEANLARSSTAARALAYRGDGNILLALVEGGILGPMAKDYDPGVIEALTAYGDEARRLIEPLVEHENGRIRSRARRALASIGPSSSTTERIASEANELWKAGQSIDDATFLLLYHGGLPIVDRLVAAQAGFEQVLLRAHSGDPEPAHILGRAIDPASGDERAILIRLLEKLSGPPGDEGFYQLRRARASRSQKP